MEKLPMKFEGLSPGDYTIRQGEADPIKHEKSLLIDGTIDAPAQFLKGKDIDPKKAHLRIFNQLGKLELYIQDTDPHTSHTITGSLKKNADLAEFNINSLTHRFGVADFLRFVKTKRYFFANKEQHAKLISNMQSWSAKIETVLEQSNDQKGNSNFKIEQKVRAVEGFVDRFELNIPIYQGDVNLKFTVEIGLDPKNTAVQLYLFSDELFELEMTQRAVLMKAALSEMEDQTFSKVVVS
jgi:hypothetical protein